MSIYELAVTILSRDCLITYSSHKRVKLQTDYSRIDHIVDNVAMETQNSMALPSVRQCVTDLEDKTSLSQTAE